MELLRQIDHVEVMPGHRLRVTFDTGDRGVVDISSMLQYPCYHRLKDEGYFSLARVARGTVVWPNDEDLAPEMLWEKCIRI